MLIGIFCRVDCICGTRALMPPPPPTSVCVICIWHRKYYAQTSMPCWRYCMVGRAPDTAKFPIGSLNGLKAFDIIHADTNG